MFNTVALGRPYAVMYYACFRPPSAASNVDITVTVDAVSLGNLKSAQATLNLVTPVSVSFFLMLYKPLRVL